MNDIRQSVARRWDGFWYADGSAYNLAAARMLFSVNALWLLLSRDIPAMSGLPDEFWVEVPRYTQWRYLLFPGNASLEYAIQGAAIVALVSAVLGVLPRVSCLSAALLLYHLTPLEAIFYTGEPVTRGFEIAILSLIVLALSPCADVWKLRHRPAAATRPQRAAWEYNWPLCLIQVLVVQVYFFSGYAKIFWGGVDWASADNLRGFFLLISQRAPGAFSFWGQILADQPVLLFLGALGSVVIELVFPVMLFWKSSRRVLIPLMLLFHVAMLLTLNVAYPGIPQLLVFVNWHWLRSRASAATLTGWVRPYRALAGSD